MFPRQFSTRTLLAFMALVAVCLAAHRLYSAWYVRNYPGHYLHSLLNSQVHNGDTRADVARFYDTAVKVDVQADPNVQQLWNSRKWAIDVGDEVWHFSGSSGHGVYLQFRAGQLINHRNSDFADPDRLAKMNRQPLPPVALRYGVWPYCVALFVITGVVILLFDKRTKAAPKKCGNPQE